MSSFGVVDTDCASGHPSGQQQLAPIVFGNTSARSPFEASAPRLENSRHEADDAHFGRAGKRFLVGGI